MRTELAVSPASRAPRSGATLLEMLVVVMILLMITAMTVPVVAPAVSGRRIREGARMVSTFINAARNRAIETGRPAGVWLERTPGLAEVCENLYMADVPQAYSGDFLDSSVEIALIDETGATYPSAYPGQQDYWNIVIPRTRTMYMVDAWSAPDPAVQTLVREGDLIQFEGHDRRYPLKVVDGIPINIRGTTFTRWWYFLRGRNASSPINAYSNHRHQNGRYSLGWWDANGSRANWYNLIRTVSNSSPPGNFERPGLEYKIFRQPQRLQAGAMRLPKNIVIDLNFSSMTSGEVRLGVSTAGQNYTGIPFHPRLDTTDPAYIDTNQGSNPNPYWGYPVSEFDVDGNGKVLNRVEGREDNTPVIIVFSSGGHVEKVYRQSRQPVNHWAWQGDDPTGLIYLLIGDRERVTPQVYRYSDTVAQNMAIQFEKNWLNLNALWIRIASNGGAVSTSLVDDPRNGGSYLALENSNNANSDTVAADPSNAYLTRVKALMSRVIGGR